MTTISALRRGVGLSDRGPVRPAAAPDVGETDLGAILLQEGSITPADLARARHMRRRQDALLSEVILFNGFSDARAIAGALARLWAVPCLTAADLVAEHCDVRLLHRVGPGRCLRAGFVPLYHTGERVLVAMSDPARLRHQRAALRAVLGPYDTAIATPQLIEDLVLRLARHDLAQAAILRTPLPESCRSRADGAAPV